MADLLPQRDIILITDDSTADELREAITHLAATAHRLPAHWGDRKKAIHDRINVLIDELEVMHGL